MTIKGIENMGTSELNFELQRGAKFVFFEYCVSIVIMTFKRPSPIYFIKSGESVIGKSLGFTTISLLFGWWGIPWGPIYTVSSVVTNLRGGKDITKEIIASLGSATQAASPAQSVQPAAKAAPGFSLRLSSGKTVALTDGVRVGTSDIPALQPSGAGATIAEVVRNPNDPNILGLKNLSRATWTVTLANGRGMQVDPNKSVRLETGAKIVFGSMQGEIYG
jgi:hypothetical protein